MKEGEGLVELLQAEAKRVQSVSSFAVDPVARFFTEAAAEIERLNGEVKRLTQLLRPYLKQEEAISAAREKMRREIAEERGSLTEAQALRREARAALHPETGEG